MTTEYECDGRCIYGWELIEGASGVAVRDPLCSLHGVGEEHMTTLDDLESMRADFKSATRTGDYDQFQIIKYLENVGELEMAERADSLTDVAYFAPRLINALVNVLALPQREWDERDADSVEARAARAYNSAIADSATAIRTGLGIPT